MLLLEDLPVRIVKYSHLFGCPVIFRDVRAVPNYVGDDCLDHSYADPILPEEWIWCGCE